MNWQDLKTEDKSIDSEKSHSFLQGNCLSSAPAAVGEHTAISWRIVLNSHFPPQDALCCSYSTPQICLLQADTLPLSCPSWKDLVLFMLADHIVLRLGNAGILLLRGPKRANLLHHLQLHENDAEYSLCVWFLTCRRCKLLSSISAFSFQEEARK